MGTADAPRRVELDAAAAAPPLAAATQAWTAAVADGWADERGLHAGAARSRRLLEASRAALAEVLGVRAEDVALPPDHGSALRAAVLGLAAPGGDPGAPVVVSAVEHSAVLHAAGWRGSEVRTVPVDRAGHVDLEALAGLVRGARLVCVQHANGEIGTAQDLPGVHEACRAAGVPLLVDAGASLGHLPTPSAWDALVASPRAWGSVPGAAVLAVRPGTRWRAHEPGEAGASRRPGEHAGSVDVARGPGRRGVVARTDGRGPPGGRRPAARPRGAGAAGRRRGPRRGRRGRPGRAAAARAHDVRALRAGRGAGAGAGRGGLLGRVRLGVHRRHPAPEPRAGRGRRPHPRQRPARPAAGTRAEDVERFCAVLPEVVADVRRRVGAEGL